MDAAPKHDKWKGNTGGTTWMQKTLVFCLGWMNLPFVYTGMALVVPFYMLFNHQGYISQYHFFRKRLGYGIFKSFVNVYINHFKFGQIILDRFAVYGGARFHVEIEGNPIYLEKIGKPEGFIQMSSHVGNFELAGYMLSQDKKPVYALIFGGETSTVMQNRQKIFRKMNIRLISVGTDLAHIYAMNNALDQGAIISMPGDRMFGSSKSISCDFFGNKAEFPLGPYLLAATKDVPIVSIFVMKESIYKYRIYLREVCIHEELATCGAKQKATMLAKDFVRHLEDIVRKYPNQWFNYYDFWK